MVLAEWQVGQVLWTFFYFTLIFIWIWLAIMVFTDIFRSPDMGGWHKAAWVIFIIVFFYIGVFVYLIVRGGKMHEHAVQAAEQQDAAMQQYIRQAAGTSGPSPVDELHRLADLKDRGVIDDAEFERMKAKITT
jgi:hypothetical protein